MDETLDRVYLMNMRVENINKSEFSYLDDEDVILAQNIYAYSTLAMVPIILATNTLVFWGMLLYPGFNTPSDLFLFSLSIADFCMGALGIPLYFIKFNKSLSFILVKNKYTCIFTFSCRKLSVDGSLWNLLIISIDRYIAVMWPLEYRSTVTRDRAKWVVVFLWTYLIFLATAPLLGLNNYDPSITSDSQRCNYYAVMKRPYVIWSSFITKAICLGIPAILYTQILYIVFKQLRRFERESFQFDSHHHRAFRKRVVMVKITSALTFLFIFAWAPYLFIAPFKYYRMFPLKNIQIAEMLVKILSSANAMVNAPIYAIGRKEYRYTYKTMLTNCPWNWKFELKILYADIVTFSGMQSSRQEQTPAPAIEFSTQELADQIAMEKDSISITGSQVDEVNPDDIQLDNVPSQNMTGL